MLQKQRFTPHWLLITITFLAFALRTYHIDFQSLWRDEVDAILFATDDLSNAFTMFTRPGENGPLYFLLLRPWIAFLGHSEFATRYFSLLWGVLSIPLVYQFGRRLTPAEGGRLGAFLVALSPYLVWYSQETKMYSLLLFLSVLSGWSLINALQNGGKAYWMGYIVATSVGFYTHILAVALLPFHIAFFAAGGPSFWRHWRGLLIAMACLTLPYLPLALWQIPTLLSPFETGHPFFPLDVMLGIMFRVLSFGFSTPTAAEVGLVIFLLLTGTFLRRAQNAAVPQPGPLPQVVLWLYILLPVFTVYLISLGMPIFTDRYLITIAPGFYLLLACGLRALRTKSNVVFVLCLAGIVVSGGRSLWFQAHTPIKADFRSAAADYRQHAAQDDLLIVQMPYVKRNFGYYYTEPTWQADGLYTNGGMQRQEVDERMRALTRGFDTVWLLKSEAELWDARDLVHDWLETHGEVIHATEFERVELYGFRLRN